MSAPFNEANLPEIANEPENPPFTSEIDIVQEVMPVMPDGQSGGTPPAESSLLEPALMLDVVAFMCAFIPFCGFWVGGNEKLYRLGESAAVGTQEEKEARWLLRRVSVRRLIHRAVEFCVHHRLPYNKSDVLRGYDLAIENLAAERHAAIWRPLCPAVLTKEERSRGEREFKRFARLIDAPEAVSIGTLKQWMWMTKRNGGLDLPVSDHLMPIFFNPEQGTGKTEFVKKLLAPLAEVATAPVNFDQVADDRSADLFSNAVINIDDVGCIAEEKVADLKSIMTSHHVLRRVLASSFTELVRQRASFIGTSNKPITELVPDGTGHRRFVMLLLRNGCVERGGEADVWKTIDSLDYKLMWRCVDEASDRGPIKDMLDELVAYQRGWAPVDPLLAWLRAIKRQDEALRRITRPQGVVAQKLWELFVATTGTEMTEKAFAKAMTKLVLDPTVPFRGKRRLSAGNFYLWKPVLPAASDAPSVVPDGEMTSMPVV